MSSMSHQQQKFILKERPQWRIFSPTLHTLFPCNFWTTVPTLLQSEVLRVVWPSSWILTTLVDFQSILCSRPQYTLLTLFKLQQSLSRCSWWFCLVCSFVQWNAWLSWNKCLCLLWVPLLNAPLLLIDIWTDNIIAFSLLRPIFTVKDTN